MDTKPEAQVVTTENKGSKLRRPKELLKKIKLLRRQDSRDFLEAYSNTSSEHLNTPESSLPKDVQMESVIEASEMIGNISLFGKSMRLMKRGGDVGLGVLPAVATGVGVMALSHIAGGSLNHEAANLLMTAAAGGSAAFDGRKIGEDLRNPNMKKIGKNAALALLFTKGMQAVDVPMPDILAGFVDDAVLPLMKFLPMLSAKTGGIK